MLRSLLLWLPRMLRFWQRWRLYGRGLWSRATVLKQVLVGPRSVLVRVLVFWVLELVLFQVLVLAATLVQNWRW